MSSIKKPYWYKLIKLLKSEGVITTGVTIPYMIGAYKKNKRPFDNIDQLVNSILNSATDKFPVIQKCPVIGHHVIMLEDKEVCNKFYKKDIRFESDAKNNSLFISSNTDLGKSLSKVCRSLAIAYESPIKREEFSWCNKEEKWKKFDQTEIDRIKRIK